MNFSNKSHQGNFTAPARSRVFSYDANQQANSLVGWEQHYDQHSNGSFSGYLDKLAIGGVHFFEEYTNQALTQQCCVNENSFWLGFSLQSNELKINNRGVNKAQIMVRPSAVDFELITPQEFHIFGLVIDEESIKNHMAEHDSEQWLTQGANVIMKQNNYVSYELAKLIQFLLNIQPLILDHNSQHLTPRIERLKPLIMSKIADLLVQVTPRQESAVLHPITKWRILDKIQCYVEETGHYPLTISELCKITFVSRRTLQYFFEREFSCSPIQYLRDCRLNEIRRTLLTESCLNSDVFIADIAFEHGFFHISTFNQHYKRLFGETPSQTITRSSAYKHILTTTYW